MSLAYEIADEYLPDVHVNGMDCPDIQSAQDIVNKVLDAAVKACKDTMVYDEYDPSRTFIESINKLRPES